MYKIPVVRLLVVRDSDFRTRTKKLNSCSDAADLLQVYLRGADREHFVVLLLDTKNRVMGIHTAAVGTLDATILSAREIFKAAIMSNAAGVILGHNHPSGDCTPSVEDVQITRRMAEAGNLLGIPVIDSIIVSDDSYYSLREQGQLQVK